MSLALWVPIVGLFTLALLFALFSVTAARFTGPHRYNRAKLEVYECGIEPTPQPIGGGRVPVKVSLIPELFILFCIVLIFLFPPGGCFPHPGPLRVLGSGRFLRTAFFAYAHAFGRG